MPFVFDALASLIVGNSENARERAGPARFCLVSKRRLPRLEESLETYNRLSHLGATVTVLSMLEEHSSHEELVLCGRLSESRREGVGMPILETFWEKEALSGEYDRENSRRRTIGPLVSRRLRTL